MTAQDYPKWRHAPEGWTHKDRPYREFFIDRHGKASLVVLSEEDERELFSEEQR